MNWSHGYNVSSGYTYGFYRELSPDWLNFGALLHGYRVPDAGGAFRYLELGCGQGFGLCLLAANYPKAEFLGVDFNPEHIAHARELARAAGLTNVRFEEADFEALAQQWPADYGRFDYVTLHGIYSWVTTGLRQALIRNLDLATHPGALVYVSYNTLPGWTSAIPLQHILRKLQLQSAKPGPEIIKQGAQLFQSLIDAKALVSVAMPPIKSRVDNLRTQNSSYLVQEYLHDQWQPLWFSQVANELAGAKLSHVGSATLPENYLPSLLSPALAEIVRSGEGKVMQQELIDLAINQSFRRDLYCRGPRALRTTLAQLSQYKLYRGHLPTDKALSISTSFGSLSIGKDVAEQISAALDKGPQTIAELSRIKALTGKPLASAVQIVTLLLHAGHLSLGRSQLADSTVKAFNHATAKGVLTEFAPYGYLAANHTPGAVNAGEIDMALYLLASSNPNAKWDAKALGAQLLQSVTASGRELGKDGKALETAEARMARAVELADNFLTKTLPMWKRLGVL